MRISDWSSDVGSSDLGWVEHDPEDIWRDTLAVLQGALAAARAGAEQVAAIGITNQRETTVIWDRQTGAAIHKAIVWQDRRKIGRAQSRDRVCQDVYSSVGAGSLQTKQERVKKT